MKALRVHPLTYVFLLILILTGFGSVLIPYIIAISLHELAHANAAKKLGYGLNKVWILPYGACVSFKNYCFSPRDEIKIALAGPIVNALLLAITIMLWWIFPQTYIVTYTFALSNFSLMVFNLLPAFPLDGGRILTSILKLKFKEKTVYKISCAINLIFSLIFLIFFIISAFFQINFSFGLISIFLFCGIFEGKFNGTYAPLISQIEKKKKDILPIKNIYLNSSVPLFKLLKETSKEKYTFFFVKFSNGKIKMLNEDQLSTLLQNNDLNTTIEEIFNKKLND